MDERLWCPDEEPTFPYSLCQYYSCKFSQRNTEIRGKASVFIFVQCYSNRLIHRPKSITCPYAWRLWTIRKPSIRSRPGLYYSLSNGAILTIGTSRCVYENATMSVSLQHQTSKPILLQRGVRQGDVIFPKLFTVALEEVLQGSGLEKTRHQWRVHHSPLVCQQYCGHG